MVISISDRDMLGVLNYEFIGFQAKLNRSLCLDFVEGHRRILLDYGIENLTSLEPEWIEMDNVYVILARDPMKNRLIGGIRLHIHNEYNNLPIIKALEGVEPEIESLVNSYSKGSLGEISGLWISRDYFGSGCAPLLAQAGVALGRYLRIESLLTIVASYTLELAQSLGFQILEGYGDKGSYAYPTPEFKSFILGIPNLESLDTAQPKEKDRLFSLSSNPNQVFVENSQKKQVLVKYILL
jgi:hypothetical protein